MGAGSYNLLPPHSLGLQQGYRDLQDLKERGLGLGVEGLTPGAGPSTPIYREVEAVVVLRRQTHLSCGEDSRLDLNTVSGSD